MYMLLYRGGDLVLMDAGCEYHSYVSDVTRTWPVSGRFSPAQSDLYEVVRTTKEELIQVRTEFDFCKYAKSYEDVHSYADQE